MTKPHNADDAREVVALRRGEPVTVSLSWRMVTPHESYVVEVDTPDGQFDGEGPDVFEALCVVRRQLEQRGMLLAVQGARLDTFPSGMARDQGAGRAVYILRPGTVTTRTDLVPTFDDAPYDKLATVAEQERYFETWRKEPKANRS